MPKSISGSNKVLPVLVVLLVIAAFGVGLLWGKVQVYEQGGVVAGSTKQQTAQAAPAQQTAPPPSTTGTASVDDDPILGDPEAPIALIEFSDFECPFCKRFNDDTLPQIKVDYIDTGKVKLVYRDLPLTFHDPMATNEAVAANCAREQGGDSKFFEYHDEIFKRTTSNGSGLSEDDLSSIATDIGLTISSFTNCLEDPAQNDEVQKDLADAATAGANGTPTFFIGTVSDTGEVDGQKIVGAQPFAAFQAVIDPMLQ